MPEPEVKWEDADWFDCEDSDTLSHSDPTEAIVNFFENAFGPGESPLVAISEHAPLAVVAWRKKTEVEWMREVERCVESAWERFEEDLAGENGDPNDGEIPRLTQTVRDEVRRAWRTQVARVFQDHGVHSWSCERVGVRHFSAAELEALLREESPDWFVEEGAAS